MIIRIIRINSNGDQHKFLVEEKQCLILAVYFCVNSKHCTGHFIAWYYTLTLPGKLTHVNFYVRGVLQYTSVSLGERQQSFRGSNSSHSMQSAPQYMVFGRTHTLVVAKITVPVHVKSSVQAHDHRQTEVCTRLI